MSTPPVGPFLSGIRSSGNFGVRRFTDVDRGVNVRHPIRHIIMLVELAASMPPYSQFFMLWQGVC